MGFYLGGLGLHAVSSNNRWYRREQKRHNHHEKGQLSFRPYESQGASSGIGGYSATSKEVRKEEGYTREEYFRQWIDSDPELQDYFGELVTGIKLLRREEIIKIQNEIDTKTNECEPLCKRTQEIAEQLKTKGIVVKGFKGVEIIGYTLDSIKNGTVYPRDDFTFGPIHISRKALTESPNEFERKFTSEYSAEEVQRIGTELEKIEKQIERQGKRQYSVFGFIQTRAEDKLDELLQERSKLLEKKELLEGIKRDKEQFEKLTDEDKALLLEYFKTADSLNEAMRTNSSLSEKIRNIKKGKKDPDYFEIMEKKFEQEGKLAPEKREELKQKAHEIIKGDKKRFDEGKRISDIPYYCKSLFEIDQDERYRAMDMFFDRERGELEKSSENIEGR